MKPHSSRSASVVTHGSHNKAPLFRLPIQKATSKNTEMRYIDYCAEAGGSGVRGGEGSSALCSGDADDR